MDMKKLDPRRFSWLAVALLLTACSSRSPKPKVQYVDPATAGRYGGTGIESQDIVAAANKAAAAIVTLPQVTQASAPPVILITPVANRSSSPIDTDIYTTKLRGILMSYAPDKVRFLARDVGTEVNLREQELRESGQVRAGSQPRHAHTYDYILTAEVRGISAAGNKARSEYFLVAFKLVDFDDLLLWENQYEIKKEGTVNRIYR